MKIDYKKSPQPKEFSIFTGEGDQPHDFFSQAKNVPCQDACPAKTDVPAYIEAIAQEDYNRAFYINLEDNVFPGVLGRVCVRPCQEKCRHQWTNTNGPVQICHLKRSGSDFFKGKKKPLPDWFAKTGKKVAVIGGGPAGLAAARNLKRYGHEVKVFEKEKQLGGMMIDGIPKFRLPRETVQADIELISESGVHVQTNYYVDQQKMNEIMGQFDAVLLATGTVNARELNIKGLNSGIAVSGLDFMKQYNHGQVQQLSGNVIIIGGGFTAVDSSRSSARAAKKLVGEKGSVTVVYRRTEQHMAADILELKEMELEEIDVRSPGAAL